MIVFEVDARFVLAEDVPLSAKDLSYGLRRGFIKELAVVQIAVHEVECGTDDAALLDLAAVLSDELNKVANILKSFNALCQDNIDETNRRWLYLELKAAYLERNRLKDPLGVVEQMYADFGCPDSIESLVRYMPLRDGVQPGPEAIMERWARFLDEEHKALARRYGTLF